MFLQTSEDRKFQKILVPGLLISGISPVVLAKPLVAFFFSLLLVFNFKQAQIKKYIGFRAFLLSLLIPGIMMTLFEHPQELIRFIPLVALIWLFPYHKIQIDPKMVYSTSIAAILFLTSARTKTPLFTMPGIKF